VDGAAFLASPELDKATTILPLVVIPDGMTSSSVLRLQSALYNFATHHPTAIKLRSV
jgi:hypothetical protein